MPINLWDKLDADAQNAQDAVRPKLPSLPQTPEQVPADGTLLEPNYAPHYHAWKADPSPQNADNLLKTIQPVIQKGLKSYARGSQASPTLLTQAKLTALNSLKRYDPMQSKLQTYLLYQLQSLQRAAAKEERIISVPEQLLLDSKHLYDTTNLLRDELGREPSDAELSDHLGISTKRIKYVRSLRQPIASSTFAARSGDDEESLFDPAVQSRDRGDAWLEFVYHDLDPTNQVIMEHALGLHGHKPLNNKEIARKLRISEGAVSQRKAIIQSKIDRREELGVV